MDTTNTDSNTQESNSEQRNNNPSVDNSRPGIIITENTIDVGRIKQMIDLNGDSINFEVSFTIKSKDGKPFEMLVTDQNTLDTKADLEYQHVPSGEISATMINDKNMYQNYFLLLKANEPCICDIMIEKKELPQLLPQQRKSFPPQEQQFSQNTSEIFKNNYKQDMTKWVKIISALVVLGIGGFLLYQILKHGQNTTVENQPLNMVGNEKSLMQNVNTTPIISPMVNPPAMNFGNYQLASKDALLEQLKHLNI